MIESIVQSKIYEFIESIAFEIAECKRLGQKSIWIDFNKIKDLDLKHKILDDPTNTITQIQETMKADKDAFLKLRIINLPNTQSSDIYSLRTDTHNFIKISGHIVRSGEILTIPIRTKYTCPSCNNILWVNRHDFFTKLIQPNKCGCGYKGKFTPEESELVATQELVIEEDIKDIMKRDPDFLKRTPRSKMILLVGDLTSKDLDKKSDVGVKVTINGFLKLRHINPKDSDYMDSYIFANSIEIEDLGWDVLKKGLTPKDIKQVKKLSEDKNIIQKLASSMFFNIHKNDEIKECLFLQTIGSVNRYTSFGQLKSKGNIHIAVVGPPGGGKTVMAKRLGYFWPIYKFTSARGVTGVGLIASSIKNKYGGWDAVPGAIPRANKGILVVDELDKLSEEHYGYLNNCMVDLVVGIDKADIHREFDTDTAILATLNPTGKTIDAGSKLHEQLIIPKDIIDRFELILPAYNFKSEEDLNKIIDIAIMNSKNHKDVDCIYNQEIDDPLILKYITYARTLDTNTTPKIDKIIKEQIKKIINVKQTEHSNRMFPVVMRLVQTVARARLHLKATEEDVYETFKLLRYSYNEMGYLDNSGFIDYEVIEGVNKRASNNFKKVRDFINKKKECTTDELVDGVDLERSEIYIITDKLKIKGDVFEPKNNLFKWMD